MVKRQTAPRLATSQTNGNLVRIYVKDWRSEPVGKLKRALRKEIAEWAQTEAMEDNDASTGDVVPDVDAIRHVNKFGTHRLL